MRVPRPIVELQYRLNAPIQNNKFVTGLGIHPVISLDAVTITGY